MGWRAAPPGRISVGETIQLYAHEVAWGRFCELESWCQENAVPFVRWSGACLGGWGAQRVVFRGAGDPVSYAADEEDRILIDRETAVELGSIEAIIAYFSDADFVVPPLELDERQSGCI